MKLRTVAELPQKAAIAQGLSRDDHMAALAEAKRRFGEAPSQKPVEDINTSISRIMKASDAKDFSRRKIEYQQHLTTLVKEPDEVKATTAEALEQRASIADSTAASIQSVMAAQDFAAEVAAARSQNKLDNPGMSATTDPETGVTVAGKTRRAYTPSVESQYLDLVAGRGLGKLVPQRDQATGKVLKQPQVSEEQDKERQQFVTETTNALSKHVSEIRAQGGVPTPEQRSAGTGLIEALQAGSGMRYSFKGAGRSSLIDPNQSVWNQWMGRKESAHFAKPKPEAVARRQSQLKMEGDLARMAAAKIRETMPAPVKAIAQTATAPPPAEALTAPEQAAVEAPTKAELVAKGQAEGFKSVAAHFTEAVAKKFTEDLEGQSDELYKRLQENFEDIPKVLASVMKKLHSATPEEMRDALAHAVVAGANNHALTEHEMAARYTGALELLRDAAQSPTMLRHLTRRRLLR